MKIREDLPIYSIGVTAELLSVHPRTLRIYEEEGLIKPSRRGNRRLFSNNDLKWIGCLRELIHEKGISIPGVKRLLDVVPCWQIKGCPEEVVQNCSAYVRHAKPCWEFVRRTCRRGAEHCEGCCFYNTEVQNGELDEPPYIQG